MATAARLHLGFSTSAHYHSIFFFLIKNKSFKYKENTYEHDVLVWILWKTAGPAATSFFASRCYPRKWDNFSTFPKNAFRAHTYLPRQPSGGILCTGCGKLGPFFAGFGPAVEKSGGLRGKAQWKMSKNGVERWISPIPSAPLFSVD